MVDLVDALLFPPDQYSLLPALDPSFALQFDSLPMAPLHRIEQGRIRFYNHGEEAIPKQFVEQIPMTARVLHRAYVSRFEEDKQEKAASQESPRHWSGAVYSGEGELLPEFQTLAERLNGNGYNKYLNPQKADRARMRQAEPLPGRFIYMGRLSWHFGHFLMESMARSWALVGLDTTTKLLFHPSHAENRGIPSFAREIFAALDVDPGRIVLAHDDLVVEQLIVPTAQFWLDWKGGPGMCIAFDHVRERLSRGGRSRPLPRRVYLTRRLMDLPLQKRAGTFAANSVRLNHIEGKTLLNEEEVEALFAARGFEIIAPETRPFSEQVMLLASASEVAGVTGSALHLALFNNNPATKLVALDLRVSVNQLIVDEIRGLRGFHVNCVASRDERGRPRLDCGLIWQALKDILS